VTGTVVAVLVLLGLVVWAVFRSGSTPGGPPGPRDRDPEQDDLVDDFVLHDMLDDEDEHHVG